MLLSAVIISGLRFSAGTLFGPTGNFLGPQGSAGNYFGSAGVCGAPRGSAYKVDTPLEGVLPRCPGDMTLRRDFLVSMQCLHLLLVIIPSFFTNFQLPDVLHRGGICPP